ncbi:MAG: hypothetical protein AMJ53_10050 [Gammaproteobacteria bacterium SG8_11]|nr:MAG: hypothetical protein AMJ53_10050 [Gammaproteobacteria bacterium SG8_11]
MGIARFVFVIFSVYLMSASHAADHRFKQESEKNFFRYFTLAVCMGMAYESDSKKLASDVGKAASGYLEFGHMDLDAYEDARELIKTWLKKDYQSKTGGQVEIMKCIDLFESEDLDSLYQKHDPCQKPDRWLDESKFKSRCK